MDTSINSVNSVNNYSNLNGTSAISAAQYADENSKIESFQDQLLDAEDDAELKDACDQFEEYFLSLMFKQMEKTTLKDDDDDSMFKEGQAEKMTKSFLYQEYAKVVTDAGGIGLSDQMYEQMQSQKTNTVSAEELLNQDANEENSLANGEL